MFSNRRMRGTGLHSAGLATQQVSLTQGVGEAHLEKGHPRVHLHCGGCWFSDRQTAEVAEPEQDDRPRQAYGRVTWWVCGTPWRRFPHRLWSSSVLNSQCNNVTFLSSGITSGIQCFLLLIWMETLFVQTPSSVGFRVELY